MQVSEVRDSEDVGRRTETSYKAESSGKAAQHVKARGAGDTVNGAVVHRKFTFLFGETFRGRTGGGMRFPRLCLRARQDQVE